jgi:ABC-2 type transport system permease protein
MLGALMVYVVGMAVLGAPGVVSAVINAHTLLLVLGFGPVAALVALQVAVLVSARVNDPRTAQQFGALLILPITGIFVMQFSGVIRLTTLVIVIMVGALLMLWALLVVLGVSLFEREAILTRWK